MRLMGIGSMLRRDSKRGFGPSLTSCHVLMIGCHLADAK